MRIIKLDASGNIIPIANDSENVSITNGPAISSQFVTGASETDGAISLIRSGVSFTSLSDTPASLTEGTFFRVSNSALVPQTVAQVTAAILAPIGNGLITNTGGVLGIGAITDPVQTGVNANPTGGRHAKRDDTSNNLVDGAIIEVTDELQSFRASINHDQGGRDFNLNPGGIPADFETNFANYNATVVSSSTTTLAQSISDVVASPTTEISVAGSILTISGIDDGVAFAQNEIVTIRYGDILIYSLAAVVSLAGLTTRSTTATTLALGFNSSANATAALTQLRASTGSRLTVVSNLTTATVTAYNPTTHEGQLGHLIDGRLAHGDVLMFAQRTGTTQLLDHLTIDPDVINVPEDTALIIDGDTTIHGNTTVTGTFTVSQPVNRSDAARYQDTWLAAIESSGFPQVGSRRLTVGGQSNIEVIELIAVEGAGSIQTWYAYLGVEINEAGTGFGTAFESVVYSTHSTDPFAAGTSTVNAPINILGTSDNDFIRDITVRGDARIGDDLTVIGDTTTTGDTTMTSVIDTTNEFTDLAASTVGRTIGFTTYQAFYTSSSADSTFHEFDFLVNATTQAAIEALTPWAVGDRITVYFPNIEEAAEMAVVDADGTIATNTFLNGLRPVSCVLDAANGAIARRAASTTIDQLPFTAHYSTGFRVFNSPTLPMTGNLTVGDTLTVGGDITTGSGSTSLTITGAEELYTKVRALATAAVVATANVPSAFSSAALVVSRTLTQGTRSTLYYSVFNTGLTTETLYISTDLTNAIHTKTLQ